MSKTQTIMNTIKWINDTFVPRGLEPIEDLPPACPGEGNSCVLARILHTNPKWDRANVSTSSINLELGYEYAQNVADGTYLDSVMSKFIEESYIELPEEVRQFIADFDRGDYPELIDIELVQERINSGEYQTKLMDNYYAWLNPDSTNLT